LTLQAIDHVMIGVSDLEGAADTYERLLGLVATGGGDHPGRGTRNRIIVLDACYLELIAPAAEAPPDHWLHRFLGGGEGLIRLALADDDLTGTVAALRGRGLGVNGPIPGSLRSPDGASRSWRTAFVGAGDFDDWRLPFLIQHDATGAQRRQRLAHPYVPAAHPLGARDVVEAVTAVHDLEVGSAAYSAILGLPRGDVTGDDVLYGPLERMRLPHADLVLAAPLAGDSGPISRSLAARGEGLYNITLSVDDLPGAVTNLRGRGVGVRVHEPEGVLVSARLNPDQIHGARIKLVAHSG